MSRQRNDTRSDWFVLLLLLGAVLLFIIIALGARAVSSPSNSRITALETQISQLSSEIATLQPTPTPTNTPRPTHTPTPTPTRTPTRAPTATDTPTPRLRPESYSQTLTVIVAHANVREGPSTAYEVLDTVQQNETFKGPFSEQDGWYRFCCVRGNQRGWIAGNLVTISSAGTASVTPTRITTSAVTPTPRSPNTPPPPSLGLAPIYTKYLQARGAPYRGPSRRKRPGIAPSARHPVRHDIHATRTVFRHDSHRLANHHLQPPYNSSSGAAGVQGLASRCHIHRRLCEGRFRLYYCGAGIPTEMHTDSCPRNRPRNRLRAPTARPLVFRETR